MKDAQVFFVAEPLWEFKESSEASSCPCPHPHFPKVHPHLTACKGPLGFIGPMLPI